MVQNCCVAGCKNVWKANSSIAYHTFPVKNKVRLAQWMQVKELKDINITAGKRICSAHFTLDSFEEHCAVKRLKRTAVPSLFGEAVQMVDNGATEIIEIWEEICTDSIPEETTALDEISEVEHVEETEGEIKQRLEQEILGEETEKGMEERLERMEEILEQDEEMEQRLEEEMEQRLEQETDGVLELEEEMEQSLEQKMERILEQETEEEIEQDAEDMSLLDIEYDFSTPSVKETKDASVQTISAYYEYREEIWKMRKKIATLRQQIKQRESSIAKTRKLIRQLTKKDTGVSNGE